MPSFEKKVANGQNRLSLVLITWILYKKHSWCSPNQNQKVVRDSFVSVLSSTYIFFQSCISSILCSTIYHLIYIQTMYIINYNFGFVLIEPLTSPYWFNFLLKSSSALFIPDCPHFHCQLYTMVWNKRHSNSNSIKIKLWK